MLQELKDKIRSISIKRVAIAVLVVILAFGTVKCGYEGYQRAKTPVVFFAPPAMVFSRDSSSNNMADVILTFAMWSSFLDKVEKEYSATVIWNGPGGWLVVEEDVVDRVKELEKSHNITFIVTDFAASAQANALCEFKNVVISPRAFLVFHQAANASTGKIIKGELDFDACVAKGYLTEEDVRQMEENNMEVWVTWTEEGVRVVKYMTDDRA